MKRLLFAALIVLTFASLSFAQASLRAISEIPFGNQSLSTQIVKGEGILRSVDLTTDGTNALYVSFYDAAASASSSSTVIFDLTCLGASKSCTFNMNRHFTYGLYAAPTSSGTKKYNGSYMKIQ